MFFILGGMEFGWGEWLCWELSKLSNCFKSHGLSIHMDTNCLDVLDFSALCCVSTESKLLFAREYLVNLYELQSISGEFRSN